jgi:two-component system sensor histidine kinase KdpD
MLLMVILGAAIRWGVGPALVSSCLGAVCLNFYFVQPTLRLQFHLAEGEDLVALVSFLVTSIAVGQLSSRAQRRANENQRLYRQLKNTFDQASELEAARQGNLLKSALLDTVTHDLRTPLTSIKAAASAINANQSRDAQQKLLDIIIQQCNRLNHFVDGMLELARVESGSLDAYQVETPVEEMISAALARAEDLISSHQVDVDCKESLVASVSPKAISQVIFSVVENAAKYSFKGTTITICACETEHKTLQVSVEDEGTGIPQDFRELVFEKFFRRTDLNQEVRGMGLGLAIARGIIEAHKGRIWVESRKDGMPGARVVFEIPGVREAL